MYINYKIISSLEITRQIKEEYYFKVFFNEIPLNLPWYSRWDFEHEKIKKKYNKSKAWIFILNFWWCIYWKGLSVSSPFDRKILFFKKHKRNSFKLLKLELQTYYKNKFFTFFHSYLNNAMTYDIISSDTFINYKHILKDVFFFGSKKLNAKFKYNINFSFNFFFLSEIKKKLLDEKRKLLLRKLRAEELKKKEYEKLEIKLSKEEYNFGIDNNNELKKKLHNFNYVSSFKYEEILGDNSNEILIERMLHKLKLESDGASLSKKIKNKEKREKILSFNFDFNISDVSKLSELSNLGIDQMLGFSVHIGHTYSIKSIYAAWFTIAFRNNTLIINLFKFISMLRIGFLFVEKSINILGPIWFTSMYEPFFNNIQSSAISCGEFSCTSEWKNGLLSNFLVIAKTLYMYQRFPKDLRPHGLHLSLDPNNWIMSRFSWPRVVFVTGFIKSSYIGREAMSLRIPCLSIMDTESPSHIASVPIPGNDDNWAANAFYCEVLSSYILYRKAIKVILWFITIRRVKRKLNFLEWFTSNLEMYHNINSNKKNMNFFFTDEESSDVHLIHRGENNANFLEHLALRFFVYKGPYDFRNGRSFYGSFSKNNDISSTLDPENIDEYKKKLIKEEEDKRKHTTKYDLLSLSEKYASDFFWTVFKRLQYNILTGFSIAILKNILVNNFRKYFKTKKKPSNREFFMSRDRIYGRRKRRRRIKRKFVSIFFRKSKKEIRRKKWSFAYSGYRPPRYNKKVNRFFLAFYNNNYMFNYNNMNLYGNYNIHLKTPLMIDSFSIIHEIKEYKFKHENKRRSRLAFLYNFGIRNKFFNTKKHLKMDNLQLRLDFFRRRWLTSFFLGRRFIFYRNDKLKGLLKSYFDYFFLLFAIQRNQTSLNFFSKEEKESLFIYGKLFFFFSFLFKFRSFNFFSLTKKYFTRPGVKYTRSYSNYSRYIIDQFYSYPIQFDPEIPDYKKFPTYEAHEDLRELEYIYDDKLKLESKNVVAIIKPGYLEGFYNNRVFYRKYIFLNKSNLVLSGNDYVRGKDVIESQFSYLNLNYRKFYFKVRDLSLNSVEYIKFNYIKPFSLNFESYLNNIEQRFKLK